MNKIYVGSTKNDVQVYFEADKSHAATHLSDTPELAALVTELLRSSIVQGDRIRLDKDMGRVVGTSDLVETSSDDKIIYAKRLNRDNYTRFAINRNPQQTSFVTVVLELDQAKEYELKSAWIGPNVPSFPGDEHATADSGPFWRKHALAWGKQAVHEGTETKIWPWG